LIALAGNGAWRSAGWRFGFYLFVVNTPHSNNPAHKHLLRFDILQFAHKLAAADRGIDQIFHVIAVGHQEILLPKPAFTV
jgi:hypothetical protein